MQMWYIVYHRGLEGVGKTGERDEYLIHSSLVYNHVNDTTARGGWPLRIFDSSSEFQSIL